MSEIKNLIVIDVTDYEDTILAPAGIGATGDLNIKEIKARGLLLIKNGSQKSRLWNLNCNLKEIVNTNLSLELNVGAVNPTEEFKKEYEIQNLNEPCLKVIETFDTERELTGINNTFLYENVNKCVLKISLTNTVDVPFTEITVKKEILEIFQETDVKTTSSGNAEINAEEGKKVLTWKVESLPANETANLELSFSVNPKAREDISLGNLKINYLIKNKKLTMINPEIRGLTDSMSGVTREESSTPAKWDCNVEFLNDSEFKVRLEEVGVSHNIPTGTETVVSESPNTELEPDKSWDKDFSIESQNVPELDSKIQFTPLFAVITRVIGEINKEPTIYHVLSAEVSKTINPPEVAAYANTDMTITNTIPNLGTSTFNTLEIIDEIPQDFVPPLEADIKVEIKNPEGTQAIQGRAEFVEDIKINPNDQSPETKHVLIVKLKDLEKLVPPKSEVILSYPLLAKNPKPEVRYNTPVEIKANVIVKGKDFIISPPEEPVLKVKYVARKLKTLKSVKPAIEEGEFTISVRIQNKGDVELENIVVKDKIPSGFVLSEFKPPEGATHEVIKKGDETELEVKITQLNGGDSININYNCSGSGDYARTEPSVTVLGREGTKQAAEPSDLFKSEEVAKPSQLSSTKAAQVHEIFSGLYKQIDGGINAEKLSELLESSKDNLPPGPLLHQIVQFAKDLKAQGDKALVGSFKDEVIAKLNDFKSKYE